MPSGWMVLGSSESIIVPSKGLVGSSKSMIGPSGGLVLGSSESMIGPSEGQVGSSESMISDNTL